MNDDDATKTAGKDVGKDAKGKPTEAGWEERSFGTDSEDSLIEGSGAAAEDVEDESDPDEEHRLDEGLEETFPASDPVSAKHIT